MASADRQTDCRPKCRVRAQMKMPHWCLVPSAWCCKRQQKTACCRAHHTQSQKWRVERGVRWEGKVREQRDRLQLLWSGSAGEQWHWQHANWMDRQHKIECKSSVSIIFDYMLVSYRLTILTYRIPISNITQILLDIYELSIVGIPFKQFCKTFE